MKDKPMKSMNHLRLAAALAASLSGAAQADAVTDWNTRTGDLMVEARLGTPPAVRISALLQTAVFEAVQAATPRGAAAVDAAVAAANRGVLLKTMPAQEAAVQAAYQAALAAIAEGPAKSGGIEAGEKAAAAVLAQRADDGAATPERYRPAAPAGSYVPTPVPAVPQWSQRKPWLMARADQFRAPPPPALASAAWARDYNEVKAIGARASTVRTPEQTEIGRFWDFSLPPIYHGVVRSVAAAPGRTPLQNARLFAAVAQAMDDGMIAVFDSKYHYNFWRPITAIRNGDQDGNDATERDAAWVPLIDVPLHPEYPSAHSILAGAVGTVLQADLGKGPVPVLATTSPTAKGVTRRYSRVEDFTQEVGQARIYEGIHFRFSTEAGLAMGQKIGELAAGRWLAP
jgi:hypothetical protein